MVDIFTYTKNVAKSVLYSGQDVVKQNTPAMESFMSTNKEVLTGLYDMAKDYRTFGKRMQQYVKSSRVYEAATEGAKAIFEDISNGTFYNKERIDRFETKAMGDMANFDDFDSSNFNMDTGDANGGSDDWDFGDTDMESSPNDDVVAAVHLSSKDNAEAVARVSAKVGANIAATNRANTMLMLNQQIKANSIMEKGFSSIFDRMGEQNAKLNSSIDSLTSKALEYYDKSLTLSQDSNNMLKEVLDLMKANAGIKEGEDKNKKSKLSYSDIVDANGMPDLRAYWQSIKRNAKNALPAEMKTLMGNGIGGEGANLLLTFVSSPLKVISDTIVKTVIPKMVTKTMSEFDSTLSGAFSGMLAQFNNLAADEDASILKQYLGKIFGVKVRGAETPNPADYKKDAIPFDGITKKAITEVIPGYLRRIESALTGDGERIFSYSTGKWSNARDLRKQYTSIPESAYKSAYADIKEEMMTLILGSGKFSKTDTKSLNENMDKFLKRIVSEDMGNPRKLMSTSIKKGKELYLDYGVDNSELMELLLTALKYTSRGSRAQLAKGAFEAKESIANKIESLIKSNTEMAEIFNGSDTDKGYTWSKDGGKRTKAPGHLYNNTIDKILDDKGHNVFYYLQMMLREMATFRENRYGADMRGGRGRSGGGGGVPPIPQLSNTALTGAYAREVRRARREIINPITVSYDIENVSASRRENEARRNAYYREQEELEKYRKKKGAKPVWDTGDEAAMSSIRSNIKQLSIRAHGDINHSQTNNYDNLYQYLKNSTDFKEYWDANHTILDEFIAEQRKERKDRREQNAELRGGYRNNDEENDYDETDENGNKKKKKKRKGKGIVNKLLEAESLQDKMDVFSEGMDEILEAPGKYLSTIIMKADEAVYNLIFGKEGVKNNKTGKEANGILDAMVIGIQNTFEKVNNWLDEKILDPIKKKLGIETFGDAVQKFFGIFGIDFNGTRDNIVDWLFKDNSIVKDIRQNIQQSWEDLMESISPGQSAQDAARAQARTDAQAVDAAITNRSATGIASRSNRNYDIAMATGRASVSRTKAKTYENYRELERTSNGRKWIRQYCLDNGIELPLTEVNYRKLAKAEVDSSNPLPSNPSSADKTRYQNDVRTAEARYLTRLHDIQVQIVNTYNQQKQDEAALQDRLRPYNEDEQFKDTADKLLGKSSLGYMMRVTEEEKSQGITKVNSIDRLSELYKLGDDTTYLKLKASPVGRLFIDNYCKVHETGPIDRMSREDAKKVQRAIVEEFNNYARTGFNNMLDMIDEDIALTEGQKRGMRERIKNGNNDWAKRRGEIYNRFDVNNPNINIPMIDANGNIVRDANGNIVTTTRQATDAEQARRISRLTDYKRRGLDEANAFLDLINGISGRTANNIENKSKEWNINFNAIEKGGLDADAEIRRLFDILPNEYRSRLVEGTRLLGTIRLGDTNAQMDQYNAAGSAGITKVLNELRAIDIAEQNKTKSQMGNFNKKNAEDLTTAMFNYLRTRDPEYLKDADGNFIYDEIEKINSNTGEKYISKEKRRNADYKSDSEIKAYILRDIFGTELNLDSFATEEDKNKEIDRLYRQIKVNPELLDRLKEKFKGELGFLGSLARGSRLVTKTGLYTIHKGEAVVPSEYVPRSINGQTPGGISKQKEIDDENRVKNRYLAYLGRRIGSAAESNVATEEVPENLQAQTTEVPNQNENPNKARKVRELKKFTGEEIYQKTLQPLNKILRDSMGDEAADKLKSNFEKFAAPGIGGGIVGGGVGLASSLVFGLAGGPIIGAAVGAAANIAKNSETFSKFLFGEKIEGQYDNGAQKRAGGLFSLETQEAWHKYFPSMAKWGAGSAVAGLFTPLGPIGGLMVGSAIGFIKKNEDFQGLLFGENGLFREEDKEKFKKALPAGIAGSAIGAIALGGPFGLLGGAVVGALGGIASTTETFKRIMLGKETQVGVDKDGNPIMKRQGGIIGTIAKISLEPIKQGAVFIKTTVTDFVKKDIVAPLKSAVKPIGNMFRNMFTEIKEGITGTLNNFFEKRLGVPVEEFIKDRILAPIGNTAKNILKFPFKLLGGAISLPFKTLGFIGNNIRANQIKRGTDNGSTAAERLDWRDNHKIRSKKIFGFGLNIDGFRKADEWINSASSADIESLRRDLSLWNDKDANYRELANVRKEDIAGSVNEFFDDKKHGGFFTKNNHARKKILELIRDDKYEEAYKLIRTLKGRDGQPLDPQQVETLINQLQNQVQLYNDVKAGRGADANYRRTMTEKLASLGFKDTLGKTNVNKIIRMLDSEKAGRKKQGLWDEGTEEMLNQGKANTQDIVSAINALTDRTVDFYNALVNGNYTEGALSKDDKDVIGKGTARRVNSAKEAQDRNRQKKNKRVEEAGNATINSVMNDDANTKESLKRKFNFEDDLLKKINTNDPESVKRANELGKYCYGSRGTGNKAGISQDGIAEAIKLSNNKYRIVEMYAKAKYFPMNGEFVKFLADNIGKARIPIIKFITSLGESKVKILMKGNTQRAHMTFIKDVVPYLVDKKNFRKYINEYISNPAAYDTMDIKEFIKRGGVYGLETGSSETAVVSRGEVIVDTENEEAPRGYATGHIPNTEADDYGWGEFSSAVRNNLKASVKNIASGGVIRRKRWDKSLSDNTFENSIAAYEARITNVKYLNRLRDLKKKKHPKLTEKELTWLTNSIGVDYKEYADTKTGINNRALTSDEFAALNRMYGKMAEADVDKASDKFTEEINAESQDGKNPITTGAQAVYHKLLSGQKVSGFRVNRKNRTKIHDLLSEYTSFADDAELTSVEKQQKQDRQTQIFEDIKSLLSYNITDDGAALKKMIDKHGEVYVNKLDPKNKKALEEGRVNNLALDALNKMSEGVSNIKGFFTDKVDGDRSRMDVMFDTVKKFGKYFLGGLIAAGGLTTILKKIAPGLVSNVKTWWDESGKQTATNAVNTVKNWATTTVPRVAGQAWDATKGFLGDVGNTLLGWAGNIPKIGGMIGRGAMNLLGYAAQLIPYAFGGAWDTLKEITGTNDDISTGTGLETNVIQAIYRSIARGGNAKALKKFTLKLPGIAGTLLNKPITYATRGAGYAIGGAGALSRKVSAGLSNKFLNKAVTVDTDLTKYLKNGTQLADLDSASVKKLASIYGDDAVLNAMVGLEDGTLTRVTNSTLTNLAQEAGTGAFKSADDIASEALKKTLKTAGGMTDDAIQAIMEEGGTKALAKTALSTGTTSKAVARILTQNAGAEVADNAINAATKLASNSVSAWMTKLFAKLALKLKGFAKQAIGDAAANVIGNTGKWSKVAKGLVGKLADISGNAAAKMAGYVASANPIGVIIQAAFSIYDFIYPLINDANAMEILGITDPPTDAQRWVAAIANCVCGLPFILGGIIPASLVITILIDVFGMDFAGLAKSRQKAKDELEAFNAEWNYSFSLDEYNTGKGYKTTGLIDNIARAIGGDEEGLVNRALENGANEGLTTSSFEEFSKKYNAQTNNGTNTQVVDEIKNAAVVEQQGYATTTDILTDIKNSLNLAVKYITGVDPSSASASYQVNGTTLASDIATQNSDVYYEMYNDLINNGYTAEQASRYASEYAYGMGSGRYSQKDKSINMRFNKSGDSVYQDLNTSGCGPIAATNLINRNIKYGTGMVNPQDAAKYALNGGYKETNGGTDPRYFTSYFKKNGINSTITSSHNAMRNAIRNGQQVVLMGKDASYGMGSTPYGPNPHYVVATGMSGKNLIVDNPESENEYSLYNADDTIKKSSKAIITNSSIKYGMGTTGSVGDFRRLDNATATFSESDLNKRNSEAIAANEKLTSETTEYANTMANAIKSIAIPKFNPSSEMTSEGTDWSTYGLNKPFKITKEWFDSTTDKLTAVTHDSTYQGFSGELPQLIYEIGTEMKDWLGNKISKYTKFIEPNAEESINMLQLAKNVFFDEDKFKKILNTYASINKDTPIYKGLNDLFNDPTKLMKSGHGEESSVISEADPSALVADIGANMVGMGDSYQAYKFAAALTRLALSNLRYKQLQRTYDDIANKIEDITVNTTPKSDNAAIDTRKAFWSFISSILGNHSNEGRQAPDGFPALLEGMEIPYNYGNNSYEWYTHIRPNDLENVVIDKTKNTKYGTNKPYISLSNEYKFDHNIDTSDDMLNSIFWQNSNYNMGRTVFDSLVGAASSIPYSRSSDGKARSINIDKPSERKLKHIYGDSLSYIQNAASGQLPAYLTPWILRDAMAEYIRDKAKQFAVDRLGISGNKLYNTDSIASQILNDKGIYFYGTSPDSAPTFSDYDENGNNIARSYIKILKGLDPTNYTAKYALSSASLANDLLSITNDWSNDTNNLEDMKRSYSYSLYNLYKTNLFNKVKLPTQKDENGKFIYVNNRASDTFGVSENDIQNVINKYNDETSSSQKKKFERGYHAFTEEDIKFLIKARDVLLKTKTQISTNEKTSNRTYEALINDNTIDRSIYQGLDYIDAFVRFVNRIESDPIFIKADWYDTNTIDRTKTAHRDYNNRYRTITNDIYPYFATYNNNGAGGFKLPVYTDGKLDSEKTTVKFLDNILNGVAEMVGGEAVGEVATGLGLGTQRSISERTTAMIESTKDQPSITRAKLFDSLSDHAKYALMLDILNSDAGRKESEDHLYPLIRKSFASLGIMDPDLFKYFYLQNAFYDNDNDRNSILNKIDSALASKTVNYDLAKTNINDLAISVFGNELTKSLGYTNGKIISNNEDISKFFDKNMTKYSTSSDNYNLPDDIFMLENIIGRDYGGVSLDEWKAIITGSDDDPNKYTGKTVGSVMKDIATRYIPIYNDKSFAKSAGVKAFNELINKINSGNIKFAPDGSVAPTSGNDSGTGAISPDDKNVSEKGYIPDYTGLGSEVDEYMFRDITKFSPLSSEAIRTFIDKRASYAGYGATSPFRPYISYIIELGNKYGIDPRVALAIMTTEEGLCCGSSGATHLAKCNYISIMKSVSDEEYGAGRMANFSTGGTRTIGGVTFNLGDAKEPTSAAGIKMGLEIVFEFLKKVSVNKRNQKSLFSLNFRPGYVFCGTIDWINTTINILKQIDALDPNTKISYVQPTPEELNYYKSLTGTALNTDSIPTEGSDSGNSFLDLLQNLAKAVFGEDLWNFFTNGFGFGNTKKTAKGSKISIFDPNRRYSGLSDIFKNGLMEGTVLAPSVASGGNFGPRYLNNGLNYHMGIDMTSSNTTTPIGSPVNGDVIEAVNSNEGYGNHVIVLDDNSNGRRAHLFGHLSKINVKSGDAISQGDIIGNMGSTGMSTGPHLHYGVNIPDANNNIDYGHYNIEEKTLNGEYNDLNKNTEMTSAHPFTSLPDSAFSQNSGWVNPELYLNDYLDANNKELAKLRGTASNATPVNDYNNPENSAFSAERMKEYEHAYNTDFDWKGITASYQATDAFVASHQARMSKSGEGSGRTLADQMIIDNINENGIGGIGGGDKLSTAEQARIRKAITTIKERDAAKHTSKPAYGMGSGGVGGAPTSISTTDNVTDEKLLASNNSQVELLLVISQTLKSIEETSRQNNALVAAIMEAVRRGEISTDSETYKALLRSLNNSSNGSGSDTTSVLVNSMMSIARS